MGREERWKEIQWVCAMQSSRRLRTAFGQIDQPEYRSVRNVKLKPGMRSLFFELNRLLGSETGKVILKGRIRRLAIRL